MTGRDWGCESPSSTVLDCFKEAEVLCECTLLAMGSLRVKLANKSSFESSPMDVFLKGESWDCLEVFELREVSFPVSDRD
mmetsp:Transcript_9743/g.12803  ORF Transcript_9743/g.12803 Transcript_9743/m.12803 type:complete len:80 (-) Transcript_9743:1814-2053(-)